MVIIIKYLFYLAIVGAIVYIVKLFAPQKPKQNDTLDIGNNDDWLDSEGLRNKNVQDANRKYKDSDFV